jgi:hypothetical protein
VRRALQRAAIGRLLEAEVVAAATAANGAAAIDKGAAAILCLELVTGYVG